VGFVYDWLPSKSKRQTGALTEENTCLSELLTTARPDALIETGMEVVAEHLDVWRNGSYVGRLDFAVTYLGEKPDELSQCVHGLVGHVIGNIDKHGTSQLHAKTRSQAREVGRMFSVDSARMGGVIRQHRGLEQEGLNTLAATGECPARVSGAKDRNV